MTFMFHPPHSMPTGKWVWVFAASEAARHAKGTARVAKVNFRAEYGVSRGLTGTAYAIPTHDKQLKALALASIEQSVAEFLEYAAGNPKMNFFVTDVGVGAAAYTDGEIGPLFARAPENCSLPEHWREFVTQARGTPKATHQNAAPAAGAPRAVERCPFCGHLTFADLVETPDGACRHTVVVGK